MAPVCRRGRRKQVHNNITYPGIDILQYTYNMHKILL